MSIKKAKISIAFIGTSDFGLPAFKKLIADKNYKVEFTITQPDKNAGRKMLPLQSPIKIEARKNNIPVYQPKNIKKFTLPKSNLDLIVVAAYGQIIPENTLNYPKFGSLNIHGSLLPKYRGASCIQAAILNGDNETGISIIKMDKNLDAGPIVAQKKIRIEPSDNAGDLFEKLSNSGADLLLEILPKYLENKIIPQAQDDSLSSYFSKTKKIGGKIDWNNKADFLERFIRAMNPWPGSFSDFSDGRKYKITEALFSPLESKLKAGSFFSKNENLYIQTASGSLLIKKIQPEGKKIISGRDFIKGYSKYINL